MCGSRDVLYLFSCFQIIRIYATNYTKSVNRFEFSSNIKKISSTNSNKRQINIIYLFKLCDGAANTCYDAANLCRVGFGQMHLWFLSPSNVYTCCLLSPSHVSIPRNTPVWFCFCSQIDFNWKPTNFGFHCGGMQRKGKLYCKLQIKTLIEFLFFIRQIILCKSVNVLLWIWLISFGFKRTFPTGESTG